MRARALPLEWLSLPLLVGLWQVAAWGVDSRFLPAPIAVARVIADLAMQGPLVADFAQTLARAGVAFAVAMGLGTAFGLVLGRVIWLDRLFGPWVLVGMNLPAIVVAIICYIGLGLTEFALVLAVVINKLPMVIVTVREGVRAFGPEYDELVTVYRLPLGRRLRRVYLPQLMPFVMTAARTGLALIWKIVLVFEVLGSDGGVGFRVSIFFQYFDMAGILAYTTVFVGLVMVVEHGVLRRVERRVTAWRPDRG